jgi:hypothetical protein
MHYFYHFFVKTFSNYLHYTAWICLFIWLMTSCTPTRYVPEGEYLLGKNKIEVTKKNIPQDRIKGYIIQKPNKKLLGMRLYLFLYSLSDITREKGPHSWLRRIGEEPVIYNSSLTALSKGQIKQYLENKGYYHAVVKDTVVYHGRNAKVRYQINTFEPFRIRNISYFFEDTGLISHILPDTVNSRLSKGMRFDKEILQEERVRIENHLKEQGYFRFSKEYIFYDAAVDRDNYSVDLVMRIREYVEGKPDPRTKVKYHHPYRLRQVNVYPDFSYGELPQPSRKKTMLADTVKYHDIFFISPGKSNVKPSVIANASFLLPGQPYKQSYVNRTYRNLADLNLIRYTNITFWESDSVPPDQFYRFVDCHIELAQKKVQSYQTELAGTNSAGDLGVRGNILYQNMNLFRGAEVFNLKLTGAIEALKNRSESKYKSMQEIGLESSIVFPKFFSPFRMEGFVRRFSPKTSISAAFNYQSRPDYTRSIANASFSYRWRASPYITHTIWPIEINYVQIYENVSSGEFLDSIRTTPLGYSFEDHLVNVARYGMELNNQTIGKRKDFVFTRVNIESAGNLVNLTRHVFSESRPDSGQVFGVPYFQYMRGDLEFSFYNIIDKQNTFVYHLFIGLGFPYGNSMSMPYEKKYYGGGPNSLRGWSTRDVGPGSFARQDSVERSIYYYPNRTGDMKLEANVEYRFKVIWKMGAAIFLDAGNVWDLQKDPEKPGADFAWNRFYKELAIGTGFGARFDFSFFLLRLDFGIRLRDPALKEGERWIGFKGFGLDDLHIKFGIGYPF